MGENQILLDTSSDDNCDVNPVEARKKNKPNKDKLVTRSSLQNLKNTNTKTQYIDKNDNIKIIDDEVSPITSGIIDMDVPMELSQDYLYEQAIDREEYFYENTERKIEIIQSLSAQGDDLKFIKEVLRNENNSDIRIAALSRLSHEKNYTATSTLIEALDDPVEEVALAALNTIVINGDRTLLPLLNEKMNMMPDDGIRDVYKKSIDRLKYSATMDMDEILFE